MGRSRVDVDVSGIDQILQEQPAKVEAWLDSIAQNIVADVRLSFDTSPPGRAYVRGTRTHVASQAGNPPNVDIGTLRDTIRWERSGRLQRKVMDGVEYGIMLEDGTEKMGARPFMVPAFERAAQEMEADAASNLNLE